MNKTYAIYIVLVLAIIGYFGYMYSSDKTNKQQYVAYDVIKEAEELVRVNALPPTKSARIYALVSSVYSETLDAGQSTECAKNLALNMLYNLNDPEFDSFKNEMKDCDTVSYDKWLEWHKSDKEFFNEKYSKPASATWKSDTPPVTPNAGNWKRIVIGENNFQVPPPPAVEKLKEEAEIVFKESSTADAKEVEDVLFYAGGPGTEGPLGIWLNIFNEKVKDENLKLSEKEYARLQKELSQTVADSFLECWKVKFTYWTLRPDMLKPEILQTEKMNNPNFPSYVSGHSTISAAAATYLSFALPEYRDFWFDHAERAKDSRLNGGIHYPTDNEEGFKLGEKIGTVAVEKLKNKNK